MTGPGRPVGAPDTRRRILDAALESFASKGFQGTSLRGVAAAAGVDDGTVRHHFRDKVGLLLATMRIAHDPRDLIPRVAAGGREGLGPRIVATALRVYASPLGLAVKQAVATHPETSGLLARVLVDQVSAQAETMFPDLSPRQRRERLAVLQTLMAGLAMSRLILDVGPMSELAPDRVVALLGPMLQAAIDGRLDRT